MKKFTASSEKAFYVLDEAICTIINRLPSFTISTKFAASRAYESNNKFKKHVEDTKQIFANCDNKEIKAVNNKLMLLSILAITLNSGGWVYIIAPIVFYRHSIFLYYQHAEVI